jgi:hypothetical protein
MVAAKLATLKLGDNQHKNVGVPIGTPSFLSDAPNEPPAGAPVSADQAADMLNVGRMSVRPKKG